MFAKCPGEPCTATSDKGFLEKAKAVLFSVPALGSNPTLPKKFKNQTWVYLNLEAPATDIAHRGEKRFSKFEETFDWTMSYMRNSDIVLPYFTINISKSTNYKTSVDFKDSIRSKVKKKTKLVAWFVTNFFMTPSKRKDVVDELKTHGIEVDIYGPHSPYKCPRTEEEKCLQMLDQKYKFYLSFENSICKDYVTEKFYKILPYDVVPIVFGGGDYASIAPPSSFIDVTTFSSIKDVADYIKKLDKNDELYAKYFEWKRNVVITMDSFTDVMLCKICQKLATAAPSSGVRSRKSLLQWWTNNTCLYGNERLNRTVINKTFNY
ncbi:FUT4 (predicted) [Pycnogonum litorale]